MIKKDKYYMMGLDQGTTSSRAIIFDEKARPVFSLNREFTQIYPQPGWVEHDATEIWGSQYGVMLEALERSGLRAKQIAGIGITNQRETTVIWEKETGKPIYNAIVWQCRRTSEMVEELKKKKELREYIHDKTGLVMDAYFSATKIKWILDHVEGSRERAEKGELLFGTIDTWLLWNLTRGEVHMTDYTNASRTMLLNIHTGEWDERLLKEFDIPRQLLPEVRPSSEVYGHCSLEDHKIPIAGMAGDQQAALFGQNCVREGQAKNTYGTGCFLLMHTGNKFVKSDNGLLTTMACTFEGQDKQYALEGSVFIGGAVIQWLRDEMRIIRESSDSEYFASKVDDNGGVYFVPAFVGLGAPYWDQFARGTLIGLTRGTNYKHVSRAALESIAYQSKDVMDLMERESQIKLKELRVDGGATSNNFLMQFQSDILGLEVLRPKERETTALGAVFLAGLAVGYWENVEEVQKIWQLDRTFKPQMKSTEAQKFYKEWQKAVKHSRSWINE